MEGQIGLKHTLVHEYSGAKGFRSNSSLFILPWQDPKSQLGHLWRFIAGASEEGKESVWCTITAGNRLHRRSHWNQSHVMTQYPKRKEEITSGCGKPGSLPPTGCNHCNVNGNSAVLGLHHNFKNRTIPTFHFSAERYNQIFCYIAAHFKTFF